MTNSTWANAFSADAMPFLRIGWQMEGGVPQHPASQAITRGGTYRLDGTFDDDDALLALVAAL